MKIVITLAFFLSALVLSAQDKQPMTSDSTKWVMHDVRHYTKRELKKFRPLVFIDGNPKSWGQFRKFEPKMDTAGMKIEIVKGQEAVARYGMKGKNGAILITTRAPSH
jgi:TonB-dependent SusC/RagA subfamily outer membrane receptor